MPACLPRTAGRFPALHFPVMDLTDATLTLLAESAAHPGLATKLISAVTYAPPVGHNSPH